MGHVTPGRGNQILILVAKKLKLVAFMFKSMEHHIKVTPISPRYGVHVNLDEEMIA